MAVFSIYDSRICSQCGCDYIGRGTISCLVAMVLWLGFGIGVTRIQKKRIRKRFNKTKSRRHLLEKTQHNESDLTLPTLESTPTKI